MGGGSQNQTTNQTYTPNSTAMSGFTNVMQGAQNIADQNQTWNPATGKTVAGQNSMQLQGYSGIQEQQGQYTPQVNEALGMTSSAGKNITSSDISQYQNPYTQQVINSTMANSQQQQGAGMANVVGNQIAQNAQGGDRAMLQKALTSGQYALANNQTISDLEQKSYNSAVSTAQGEKSRQLQAGSNLMSEANSAQNYNLQGLNATVGAGNALQTQQQNENDAATQNATSETMWPMQMQQWLSGITGSMGSLMGGTTTGSGKTEEHPGFYNYLGAGMGGLSAMSDERVKENKRVIGELFDGQKVYAFNYRGQDATQLGLMAQEVERRHPESVGRTGDGIKTVQYDMATDRAAKRGHFADGGAPGFSGSDPWNPAGSPWGSLIQGAPQVQSNGFQPPVAAGSAPAPMSSKDKEQRAQTQQGKQGGQGAKDIWDKYLNKSGTPGTEGASGTSGTTPANGWEAQTVPSSELGGATDVTVMAPAKTVGESSSGFMGAGSGGVSPAAGASAAPTGAMGSLGSAGAAGAAGAAPAGAAAAPIGEAATGFGGAATGAGGAGLASTGSLGAALSAGMGGAGAGLGAAGAGAGAGAAGAAGAGAGAAGAAGAGAAGAGTAAAGTAAAGAGGAAGGGLAALIGALFSDERMKENKRVVGKTYDGQHIYAFNYKGHPMTQLGLMAQEVERRHPEAVGEHNGVKIVQYDRAIRQASRRGHFADGGDVSSNDEMRRRAERFLNLASGGAADFADGGEPFTNPDDFALDAPVDQKEIQVDTPDIRDGMWRAPHETRTHYDPYMGKFPVMEPVVPHESVKNLTRAPDIPKPDEPQTRVLPDYAPKLSRDMLSDRPVTSAPLATALVEAKMARNQGLVQPPETMARGRLPAEGAGQNPSFEIPKFPAGVDVADVGRKAIGKITEPYEAALRDRVEGAGDLYAQAGREARGMLPNMRLPNRADVSELMRSARGAGQMAADYVSPGARMEREQAADAGGEFRWNPAAGRSEFVSGEQLAREMAARHAGTPGQEPLSGTPQQLAQSGMEPTPPLPERNIVEQSRLEAERAIEDERRAKVKQAWDAATGFADTNLRLNAPAAGPVTPEAARVQAEQDRAGIADFLTKYFPHTFGGQPIAPAAAPAAAPAGVTPHEKGPEAYPKEVGLGDVAPTKVHSQELTDLEKELQTKVEPYSAAVGAPKAQTFQEQQPDRYAAGAQTSMTKRLKFENDLGGVTRDTGGNPSMGNYGILARKGGQSSGSDFYDNYGEKLGFTHDPRHDPWGFSADWKRIAKENPQGLEAAEDAWHNKFIKGSVRAHVVHAGLPGSVAEDPRVQEYFQDRYVQHGTGISKEENGRNGPGRLKQAWAKAEGDIPAFLKEMSAIDKAHIRHDFETYLSEHPDHQPGLEKRISNRLAGALGEKVQPGGTSEQVTQAAADKKETAANTPKSAADLLPHEQNQVEFIQKILGGWNPLEGITGPGKEGKDSWNPLGLTSDQRRNLMMVGLQMAGGSPLGMRALAGGASGMAQAQQMQMNEQSMGIQRAKLALEAMNQPKFTPVHWTDFMGMQHAGSMDVHSGSITEAGQTAPVPTGSIAPGTVQPAPGAAGAAPAAAGADQPTGDASVDQMFKQYPEARASVESLLEGRMTLSQIPMRQRAGMEMAANAVARTRGGVYDPVKIQKQSDFERDFLKPDSKTATQAESVNRASEHIGTMMDLSSQLGKNTGVGDYLSGKMADNFTMMRDPIRERYKNMGRAVASELAKLESGGKGAQKTTEEWESMFDPSLPKSVRDANIMNAFDIMKGNMKGLDQKWINGARKGKNGPVIDYMAPEARKNMHTAQLRYEQATGKTPEGTKSTVERPPASIPVIREQLGAALKKAKTPEGRQAILEKAKSWGVYGLETQP